MHIINTHNTHAILSIGEYYEPAMSTSTNSPTEALPEGINYIHFFTIIYLIKT